MLITLLLICSISCSNSIESPKPVSSENTPKGKSRERAENSEVRKKKVRDKNECYALDVGAKNILKSQTFPIDFVPFENSCFVTVYDSDSKDIPIGSEISIYKNGGKVYKFETRYHSDAATCWITTVSFKDLNDDGLMDIIVIGKCGAKSGEIQGNEVFINTGKGFRTNVQANDRLENLSKIEDIAEFVKNNKKLFSKQ